MTMPARRIEDAGASRAALADAMERMRRRMLALARRMVRDEHDAADVVQEAYLNAWRAFDGFDAESRLSTWLHRIVVNAALMRLRARRRSREDTCAEVPAKASLASTESAEAQVGRRQVRAVVRRCVAALPPAQRRVVELRDLHERDTPETARLLRTSRNAVKVRLHRARRALRPRLAATLSLS